MRPHTRIITSLTMVVLILSVAWMSILIQLVGDSELSRGVPMIIAYFSAGYLSKRLLRGLTLSTLGTLAASVTVAWLATLPVPLGYLAQSDPAVFTARILGWLGSMILYEVPLIPFATILGVLVNTED